MTRNLKFIFIIIIIQALNTLALSQPDQYKIYNINSENGLISDYTEFVYQDSYGFFWIANFEGLSRWDGHSFKRYQHNDTDSSSLSQNIVYCVFEDSKKRLWVGTIGGLDFYDREKDCFIHCKLLKESKDRLPVNVIKEDSKKQLWLGTSNGLWKYNHDNNEALWIKEGKNGLSSNVIFAMDIDQHDNLWLGTFYGGVNKYNTSSGQFTYYNHIEGNKKSICSNKIKSIMVDHHNQVWVGSFNQGISLIGKDGNVKGHYSIGSQDKNITTQNIIYRLYEDKNHNIWAGAGNEYLHFFDKNKDEFKPFTNLPYKNYYIPCKSISSMHEDSFGNLWFGSAGYGLFYTNHHKNVFKSYHKDYDESGKGLKNEVAISFFEDKHKNLWIGTNGGGLTYFEREKNKFTTYTIKNGLSSNAIHDIKEDKYGKLWLATWSGGLTCFDPTTNKTVVFMNDPNDIHSLIYNNIKCIVPDDTILWIATHGEGIAALNLKTKNFIHHLNNKTFPFDMHAPSWMNHMMKDSKGRLWIGGYGGLFVFDGKKMQKFNHTKDPGSIAHTDVNMITEDRKGRIWIVTEGGGLDLFDENKNSFIHFSEQYGITKIIKSIVIDEKDKLWLGTNEGLIMVDPETNTSKKYESIDGLQGNFFFLKAALRLHNGELCFGGTNGFNLFHPDALQNNPAASDFYFTDVYIFDQLQHPDFSNSVLKKVMLFTDTITLNHAQSFFTIGFTDVNLYSPNKTQYAYKLEGLHNHWVNIRSDRKVSFTNLNPGTYKFKVKYTGLDGEWKESNKAITIMILPPWWKTWWFKTMLAASLICSIALIFYFREKSIIEQNKNLEKEVNKRTNELSEANAILVERSEEIKSQNEKLEEFNQEILRQSDKILKQQEEIINQNKELEITVKKLDESNKTKDRFFNILAHDLKNPVSSLTSLSSLLSKNLSNLGKEEILEYAGHINKSSAAVYQLLINLLDWARTQSNNIQYKPASLNLKALVQKIIPLIHQSCREKHIELHTDISESHFLYADINMTETIIRNILSNSIKFTPRNGSIWVGSQQQGEKILILIQDTGVGMTEDEIKQLFKIDKPNISRGTEGESGTGLGLMICKDFIETNNGTLQIESEPGKGSIFKIILPSSPDSGELPGKLNYKEPENRNKEETTVSYTEDEKKMLKGKRIMVVDDNPQLRAQLRYILSGTFEIFEAENGLEGINKSIEVQPHLIISDMVMPKMDGLEFCRTLKQNAAVSHIPVILLTAQEGKENQLQGYEAGADRYLTKPVIAEALFAVIFSLIKNQELIRNKILKSTDIFPSDLKINSVDENLMKKITDFIEENISDHELDYKKLCELTSMSRTVLYAKIKTITGQGVNDFIKTIRLKKSLPLLMKGNLTVSQIAYEVGFSSPSYYIRCFTKEYEISPKEYVTRILGKRNA